MCACSLFVLLFVGPARALASVLCYVLLVVIVVRVRGLVRAVVLVRWSLFLVIVIVNVRCSLLLLV